MDITGVREGGTNWEIRINRYALPCIKYIASGNGLPLQISWLRIACNVESWIGSPGWEDPLEKGKATHSSILA